jgi:hypothetical protein
MPPVLSVPKDDTKQLLAEKFLLWEQFNGSLNVRTTLGYAVACVFSREIIEKLDGFPILFKFGERGTGKSTSMDWFMALFGYQNGNRQSVSKQNTVKSVIRRMTLPRSFPFFPGRLPQPRDQLPGPGHDQQHPELVPPDWDRHGQEEHRPPNHRNPDEGMRGDDRKR